MGLDQFIRTTAADIPAVDFDIPEDAVQIHYWRKHPNMHGWMERLYRDKGGRGEDFNCDNLRLDLEDLVSLEIDLKGKRLPTTEGFFFGRSNGGDEELKDDLQFIEAAKGAIECGLKVFYRAWW